MAVAWHLCKQATAASLPDNDRRAEAARTTDAVTLLQFYPTPLATSPVGAIEDKAVWLGQGTGADRRRAAVAAAEHAGVDDQAGFRGQSRAARAVAARDAAEGVVAAKSVAGAAKWPAKGSGPRSARTSAAAPPTPSSLPGAVPIMDTRNATVASGVRGPLVGNQLYQLPGYIAAARTGATSAATRPRTADSTVGRGQYLGGRHRDHHPQSELRRLSRGGRQRHAGGDTVDGGIELHTRSGSLDAVHRSANGLVNIIYFAMPAQLSANIIFDVVGYFAVSQATKLDCQYPLAVGSGPVADGGDVLLVFAAMRRGIRGYRPCLRQQRL